MEKLIEYLEAIDAWEDDIKWVRLNNVCSLLEYWEKCSELDPVICMVFRERRQIDGHKTRLVKMAASFARQALHTVPELRVHLCKTCIDAAERWANEPTVENSRKAQSVSDSEWTTFKGVSAAMFLAWSVAFNYNIRHYILNSVLDAKLACPEIDFASQVRDFFPEMREILAKKDNELGLIA